MVAENRLASRRRLLPSAGWRCRWETRRAAARRSVFPPPAPGEGNGLSIEFQGLLRIPRDGPGAQLSFNLIKRNWSEHTDRESFRGPLWDDMQSKLIDAHRSRADGNVRISVEVKGARLTTLLNDVSLAQVQDGTFADGYVGMALFGVGTTLFRDLVVEGSAASFGFQ